MFVAIVAPVPITTIAIVGVATVIAVKFTAAVAHSSHYCHCCFFMDSRSWKTSVIIATVTTAPTAILQAAKMKKAIST